MTIGTKLLRIGPSYKSIKIKRGAVYTYAGTHNGFIKLKELSKHGYSWSLDQFKEFRSIQGV